MSSKRRPWRLTIGLKVTLGPEADDESQREVDMGSLAERAEPMVRNPLGFMPSYTQPTGPEDTR